jgi:hypothetical protein
VGVPAVVRLVLEALVTLILVGAVAVQRVGFLVLAVPVL